MSESHSDRSLADIDSPKTGGRKKADPPVVTRVGLNDLLDIVAAGMRDFWAAPQYGLVFSGIYAVGGWVLILMLLYLDLPYLVYPLAAGFALIAPFIASGFYVVSKGLEETGNRDASALTWTHVFGTVARMFQSELGWMALVTGFTLFLWMDIAALLTFGFMGFQLFSFSELFNLIFTTPAGWLFLLVGNAAGAVIAFAVFSYSAISIPMLFDRDVDFVTAMITSVRFVFSNMIVMGVWCATIAVCIGLSFLSGLLGLLVMLPIIGHASWHLYRRAVAA